MADLAVTGANPVQKVSTQSGNVDQQAPSAGLGSVADAGALPVVTAQSYQAITHTLSKHFPTITGDKIDILIAEASLKLKDIVGKTDVNELITKEEQKRQNAAEQKAAAEDAQKAMEEAKAAEAKAKKSGLLGKIFGGIATALSIVAAGLLIASGVGAPLAAALIVGVVASTMLLIDGAVAERNGTGILGSIATAIMEAKGFSDEAIERNAAKWDAGFKGFMIAVMLIAAVASLGMMVSGVGAAASAGGAAAASGTANGAGGTINVAEKGSRLVTFANTMKPFVSAAQSGTQIAASGISINTAMTQLDAARGQADAQELQADRIRLQALNELLDDFIDQILARISGSNSIFNAILDDVVASIKDRGDTLARAKFTG
ncbi:MAG: type III secretion system translocon subunit SctE [Pseudomonadota bacterium]